MDKTMDEPISVGIAVSKITPPIGTDLTGYIGRPGPTSGVHDDIYARAIVFDDGPTRISVLTLDLLGLNSSHVGKIRLAAADKAEIPVENMLIACSHTHAGPAVQFLRQCGEADEDYVQWMLETAADTIIKAASSAIPQPLFYTSCQSDIGKDRRGSYVKRASGAEAVEREAGVLIIGPKTRPAMVLFNYPCHGTVLGRMNTLVSGDWMGAACREIEKATGADAMFLQGCCGNINPAKSGGFDVVEEIGRNMAANVIESLASAEPLDGRLGVITDTITLPVIPPPPVDELMHAASESVERMEKLALKGDADLDLEVAAAQLLWAVELSGAVERGTTINKLEIELQAIRIGELKIAAIPGEPFVEIGQRIKSEGRRIMVAGYANGNIGYIPTAEAYQEGGYEVESAYHYYGLQMIGPDSERMVTNTVSRLLAAL